MKVLDLFCGCGGMSSGFEDAGFTIKYGIDNWEDALQTFALNHKSAKPILEDLSIKSAVNIIGEYQISDVDVIIGGPPCQGFSIAGKRNVDDKRNKLYKSFVEFVNNLKPTFFVMENVPNILSMGKGSIKDQIISDFKKIGYNTECGVLIASNYGVPQNRKRAFFIGTKKGSKVDFPKPYSGNPISVYDAISDLPDTNLNDNSPYLLKAKSDYQTEMRKGSKGIYNHQLTNHTEKTQKIISLVPDGGNYKDLPEQYMRTRKVNIAWTRLNSKKPSFTIDTGHRHHFHYKFNRVPTVRESARIQSFRDTFIYSGSKTSQYKQVGNAVPPLLSKCIAKQILKAI